MYKIRKEYVEYFLKYKTELMVGDIDGIYRQMEKDPQCSLSGYVFTQILLNLGYTSQQILYKMTDTIYYGQFNRNTWNNEILILPNEIECIEGFAFNNGHNIKKVKLTPNLKSIEQSAFQDCSNLEEINFEDTQIYSISDYAFDRCISLKTLKLPKTIRKVDDGAFKNCTSLKDVYIDLKDNEADGYMIFSDAFKNCNLTIHFNNGKTWKV